MGELGRYRVMRVGVVIAAFAVLSSCSSTGRYSSNFDPRYGVSTSARVVAPGDPVPKGGGVYRVGQPYVVAGQTYVPEENTRYRAEGIASWYGEDFHGRLTANGEVFDMNAISAAHPTLPMQCYARVTSLANGRSLIVRVNDRGPYHQNRVIDLSVRAAQLLGFHGDGLARVRVEYVGRAPLEGSDDQILLATLREGEPAPAPSLVRVASAAPFVPRTGVSRLSSNVPLPADRPLTLGEIPTSVDYAGSPNVSASPREQSVGVTSPPRTAVSIFASPDDGDTRAAMMSGRGLY
jgi:peptidoglycan lytic transglycosylase